MSYSQLFDTIQDGELYYYNSVLGRSSWELPVTTATATVNTTAATTTAASLISMCAPWEQKYTEVIDRFVVVVVTVPITISIIITTTIIH